MINAALVASLLAFGLRLLLTLWVAPLADSFAPRTPPTPVNDPSELSLLREELVSLQRLVAAQERSVRAATSAANSAAALAATASAAAAAASIPQVNAGAAQRPATATPAWSEAASSTLLNDLRALQQDLAPGAVGGATTSAPSADPQGLHLRIGQVEAGLARMDAHRIEVERAWAEHKALHDYMLDGGEVNTRRLELLGSKIEGEWADLHIEKRRVVRTVSQLREALGGVPTAAGSAHPTEAARRAGPAAAAAATQPSVEGGLGQPTGAARRVGDTAAPAAAAAAAGAGYSYPTPPAATPTISRRKPARVESVEDWERAWAQEDAEEAGIVAATPELATLEVGLDTVIEVLANSVGRMKGLEQEWAERETEEVSEDADIRELDLDNVIEVLTDSVGRVSGWADAEGATAGTVAQELRKLLKLVKDTAERSAERLRGRQRKGEGLEEDTGGGQPSLDTGGGKAVRAAGGGKGASEAGAKTKASSGTGVGAGGKRGGSLEGAGAATGRARREPATKPSATEPVSGGRAAGGGKRSPLRKVAQKPGWSAELADAEAEDLLIEEVD